MIRCSPVIVREDFLAFSEISRGRREKKDREREEEEERERVSLSSDAIDLPPVLSPPTRLRSCVIISLVQIFREYVDTSRNRITKR